MAGLPSGLGGAASGQVIQLTPGSGGFTTTSRTATGLLHTAEVDLSRGRPEEAANMTTWHKTILAATSAVAILFGGGLAAVAAARSPAADAGVHSVTPALQQDLRFTREEERAARDLYQQFAGKYDALP